MEDPTKELSFLKFSEKVKQSLHLPYGSAIKYFLKTQSEIKSLERAYNLYSTSDLKKINKQLANKKKLEEMHANYKKTLKIPNSSIKILNLEILSEEIELKRLIFHQSSVLAQLKSKVFITPTVLSVEKLASNPYFSRFFTIFSQNNLLDLLEKKTVNKEHYHKDLFNKAKLSFITKINRRMDKSKNFNKKIKKTIKKMKTENSQYSEVFKNIKNYCKTRWTQDSDWNLWKKQNFADKNSVFVEGEETAELVLVKVDLDLKKTNKKNKIFHDSSEIIEKTWKCWWGANVIRLELNYKIFIWKIELFNDNLIII